MSITTLKERKFKAGYIVRKQLYTGDDAHGPDLVMTSAFNLNGDYIGRTIDAYRLVVKRGILPEKSKLDHSVCSIGFSEKEQKWFGWSHRAICGFAIGDTIETDEHCLASEFGIGFTARTLDDARKMAVAFAEYVS